MSEEGAVWSALYEGEAAQRVNRWLAQAGVCSRREAESYIAQGRVRIDGAAVADAGRKIEPGQRLTLERGGEAEAPLSLLLNKPPGYVSAQPEAGQTPAARLLTAPNRWGGGNGGVRGDASLPPLGRLDRDSRGLLLLSQDGVLAKAVIGPDSRLDKEYRVRVSGPIDVRKLRLLRHGLQLDGRELQPAEVTSVADQVLRFVLREGRNRQIRRMCEAVELRVVDLQRLRIGPLRLGELPEGRWRPLGPKEREMLVEAARTAGG